MQQMWNSSHIAGGNVAYVEELYEQYLRDPDSIDAQWRNYFEQLPPVNGAGVDVPAFSHSGTVSRRWRASQPDQPFRRRNLRSTSASRFRCCA